MSNISLTPVNQGSAIQTPTTVNGCDCIAKFAGWSVAVITFVVTIFLDQNSQDGNIQYDDESDKMVLSALFAAGISGFCAWGACKIIGDRCLQSRAIAFTDPENNRMAVTDQQPPSVTDRRPLPPQSPPPDHLSTITEPVALKTESVQHFCSLEQVPAIADERTPLVSRG